MWSKKTPPGRRADGGIIRTVERGCRPSDTAKKNGFFAGDILPRVRTSCSEPHTERTFFMANDKQPTGFTKIPNWILLHPDLGRIDLHVYLTLAYHADNKTRTCWPSHKLIMAETRIGGLRHLKTSLRRLEQVGAVVINSRKGYANGYYLPPTPYDG